MARALQTAGPAWLWQEVVLEGNSEVSKGCSIVDNFVAYVNGTSPGDSFSVQAKQDRFYPGAVALLRCLEFLNLTRCHRISRLTDAPRVSN